MRKKITKWLMLALTYAPIASVAVAAQAKANEIDGELQSLRANSQTYGLRSKVLGQYQMSSSMEEAKQRYADRTGLRDSDLELAMAADLNSLSQAGLIQYDEKSIAAEGPSEHY